MLRGMKMYSHIPKYYKYGCQKFMKQNFLKIYCKLEKRD